MTILSAPMRLLLLCALGMLSGSSHFAVAGTETNPGIAVQILADTNRDGIVDQLDSHDKTVWSSDRGAIFLPNIGDRHRRCPSTDLNGGRLGNDELAACNDASGDSLLNPLLSAPLQAMPLPSVSDEAFGNFMINPSATGRVRLFWLQASEPSETDSWAMITEQNTFNATSLRQGIRLAIDGRELVTNASVWDGTVVITFSVTDSNRTSVDSCLMKQAPVLLHHHLQPVETVLVTAKSNTSWQSEFANSLQTHLGALDSPPELVQFTQSEDIWAQDFLEPGYVNMPGPDGTISLRVLLRSAQSGRDAGRQVFAQLRGPGVGGYQPGPGSGFGFEEVNSGGNIETIPPYVSRSGKAYPNGRIVTARQFERQPADSMLTFLESQNAQPQFILESGWLAIGHVDEMVQVIPSPNMLGFTLAVPDVTSGLDILRAAQKAGHGSVPVSSYDGDLTPDPEAYFLDPDLKNLTIGELLADESFLGINQYAQGFFEQNLNLLLDDIPLTPVEIVRIPTLWKDVTYPWPATPDGLPRRLRLPLLGQRQVKSFFPQSINGLLLGHEYLAPKPFGPVVDGTDILEKAVVEVYNAVGVNVSFIDDFMSHHVRGGEVHCATNSLREATTPWKVFG
jgi:protein-arginine deiminase